MIFKNIECNYSETSKEALEEIKEIPETKGIFMIFGTKNCKSYEHIECLIIFYAHNLKYQIKSLLTLPKKYNCTFTSIKYMECTDVLKGCSKVLELTKKYQPKQLFVKIIKKELTKEKNEINPNYIHGNNDDFLTLQNIVTTNFIDLSHVNSIPNNSGIYFLYNKEYKLMYIGKSVHLHSRLLDHINKRTHTWDISDNFKYVKYIEVEENQLEDCETYCINEFKPLLNAMKVYTYHSERYNPEYNKTLSEFGTIENLKRYEIMKRRLEEEWHLQELIDNKRKELDNLENLFHI